MNKSREIIRERFNQYLQDSQIEPGLVPVSVESIMAHFLSNVQNTPVTKSLIGRLMSGKFIKKQMHVKSNSELTQCYYLNKEL